MEATTYKARKRRGAMVMAAGVIGLLAGTVVVVRAAAFGLPHWLAFAAMVLLLAATFRAMMPWWRGLDHMQQDSQYQCWYWGGNFGGSIALVAVMIFAVQRTELVMGAVGIYGAQLIGFVLHGIYWRIRHGGGGL